MQDSEDKRPLLLRLPRELRDEIWCYVLCPTGFVTVGSRGLYSCTPLPNSHKYLDLGLLSTCKQIHAESKPLFLKHNTLILRKEDFQEDLTGCPFRKVRVEIDITEWYGDTTRDILAWLDGYAKKGMWDIVEIQLPPSNALLDPDNLVWISFFLDEADIDPPTHKPSDLMHQFLQCHWDWEVSPHVRQIRRALENSSLKGVERRIVLDQCRSWQYELAHKYFSFVRIQKDEEEEFGMKHPWALSWLGFPLDWANGVRSAFDAEFWLDGKMLPREGSAELIAAAARRQQNLKAEYDFVEKQWSGSHRGSDFEDGEDDSSEEERASMEGQSGSNSEDSEGDR
jgi:hypothetical protein